MKKQLISALYIGGFATFAIYKNFFGTSTAQADTQAIPTPTTPINDVSTTVQEVSPTPFPVSPSTPESGLATSTVISTTTVKQLVSTSKKKSTQTLVAKAPITIKPISVPVIMQPKPVATPKPTGEYTDGTYTGPIEDAYYGNVQVAVLISGGRLSNVSVLQYPQDRSTSRIINQQAMPELVSEAIHAQSAKIDGISGASESSPAFIRSLSSALYKAKA
jgi:uncharacterized protein with FMN-binding domain